MLPDWYAVKPGWLLHVEVYYSITSCGHHLNLNYSLEFGTFVAILAYFGLNFSKWFLSGFFGIFELVHGPKHIRNSIWYVFSIIKWGGCRKSTPWPHTRWPKFYGFLGNPFFMGAYFFVYRDYFTESAWIKVGNVKYTCYLMFSFKFHAKTR